MLSKINLTIAMKLLEDVEKLIGDRDPVATTNVAKELLSKYRFIENSMNAKLTALLDKLPELKDAMHTLERLKNKVDSNDTSEIRTIFKVSDTLYSEAAIPCEGSVFLWLGANTMVEYPVGEAIDFLKEQYKTAQDSIESIKKELEWLRSQLTATEITVSRLHNYSVMKRAQEQDRKS
ncbi:bifunctional Prefoldin/Prefoldin subunit 3/Prefoldin alpha-like [Babesia duncani]|uniref:Prefoldin subunit 3 n=1 Tax=Babesia duncani TaxID=323732 RepID=A0AAD9PL62_9APIC|nr:bifunctional Prefoldin/Prefoldin subunit 3/Prefoldin alpha-like [Babesia duncani]